MKRFPGTMWLTVAAVAIVVTTAQVTEAQRGEGRRGRGDVGGPGGPGAGFGLSSVHLASMPTVQEELSLTDDQKENIDDLNEETREKAREAFEGRRGDFRQVRGELQKLRDEATAELTEVLDEQQQKRLAGIVIQVNEAGALADPLVAAVLDLTEEQNSKVADIRESHMSEMREQFRERRPVDLSREEMREMREKMEQRRDEAHKELMAVLTSEQQSEFESLPGEPVEIERPRFGGAGGLRALDGRERRGDRDRDRVERRRQRTD